MTCSLCGSIPDVTSANTGRDERFGPPITSLKRNGIASDDDLWECPECEAVFLWHDYTAQTGSGNNDEETLNRLPPQQSSFVRTFLHRGERRAQDAAQNTGRLLELADRARDLLLAHLLRHDRELAGRLVPWMLDEIGRRWTGDFVTSFASSSDDATLVMSELSRRPPSDALEKVRAHCKRTACSICRTIQRYPVPTVRRDGPLPAPFASLVQLGASSQLDLWECPECESLFEWESKDGVEGKLSREVEPLASSLRACIHRAGIVPDADVKRVFDCDAARVVILHGLVRDRELVRQLMPRMVSALAMWERPWLCQLLGAFVHGDRDDAKMVLDEIGRASRTNASLEDVAKRCRHVIETWPS